MPEVITTPATTEAAAPTTPAAKPPKAKANKPAKAAAAPKAKKPAAAPKPKKAAAAATATAEAPAKEKKGLRSPQERILKALAKAGEALTRKDIAAAAPVDVACCVEYIGSPNPEKRAANDTKHFPSLLTLGYVKEVKHEGEPPKYDLTAAGKKVAAKLA